MEARLLILKRKFSSGKLHLRMRLTILLNVESSSGLRYRECTRFARTVHSRSLRLRNRIYRFLRPTCARDRDC